MGACQSSMRERRRRGRVVEGGTKHGQGDEESEGILRRAYTASANQSIRSLLSALGISIEELMNLQAVDWIYS